MTDVIRIKLRPSSHSDDITVIGTYKSATDAQNVEAVLKRLIADVKKNPDSYDIDWNAEDASVWRDKKITSFCVNSAGYLKEIFATMQKPAMPKKLESFSDYQELDITFTAPKGSSLETLMLILTLPDVNGIKWLNENCKSAKIKETPDSTVYTWSYSGDALYDDGEDVLYLGSSEIQVENNPYWTIAWLNG